MLLLERGAGAFSISDVAQLAGVAQGTFYNYANSIDELVEVLSELISASLAALRRNAPSADADPVAAFVFKTRLTLGLALQAPDYGRLLFDSGLPVDRLLSALRLDLEADIRSGAASGIFVTADVKLSSSIIAGCLLGVALDLHRGKLPKSAIEATTTEMLVMLGIARSAAQRAASVRPRAGPPPVLPLQWLSLITAEGTS